MALSLLTWSASGWTTAASTTVGDIISSMNTAVAGSTNFSVVSSASDYIRIKSNTGDFEIIFAGDGSAHTVNAFPGEGGSYAESTSYAGNELVCGIAAAGADPSFLGWTNANPFGASAIFSGLMYLSDGTTIDRFYMFESEEAICFAFGDGTTYNYSYVIAGKIWDLHDRVTSAYGDGAIGMLKGHFGSQASHIESWVPNYGGTDNYQPYLCSSDHGTIKAISMAFNPDGTNSISTLQRISSMKLYGAITDIDGDSFFIPVDFCDITNAEYFGKLRQVAWFAGGAIGTTMTADRNGQTAIRVSQLYSATTSIPSFCLTSNRNL